MKIFKRMQSGRFQLPDHSETASLEDLDRGLWAFAFRTNAQ